MGENGLKTPIRSQPGSSSSGLTLVIPSLKALKAKQLQALSEEPPSAKKTPRPVKLKPLREVLSSLITKIKKKDDYAFFLHPVDASQVPGYSELIQRPMDFGTMTTKVEKGRYRSLEEFSSDFQLVISNAKAFNPPGTIYHQEACRIEAWGSEHIAKSAAHVIEYETDWNIEIERDDEVVIDGEDDDAAGPSAGPTTPARRSPSVSSSVMPPAKRARGAAKKTGMPSETLEADGHLPGHKDGITAFPPGSDWAELMVALKLKGKRYKTKKERMRIEKGGPPYTAEGSIDYGEMEDPFNLLSVFVPDAPTNLQLTPIYPPNAPPDASETLAPAPVNTLIPEDTPPAPIAKPPSDNSIARTGCPKYRFWTVNRHTSSRAKAKEREDDEPPPPTAQPRTAVAADFGAFSTLPARLARESRVPAEHEGTAFTTEEKLFDALRESIEKRPRQGAVAGTQSAEELVDDAGYWTQERAMQAQDYIREVVYGGVDGLAYLRSVAEFITPGDAVRPHTSKH
ncbi:hypothetical protein DENSPDRAFT_267040 [Dentipellis sp. KUC8613]|nr:hypothetical protein DENSPDRAFT_267040 [Dentipellis sp. KUC8613]